MDYLVALDRIKSKAGDDASDITAAVSAKVSTLEADISTLKNKLSRADTKLNKFTEAHGDKDPLAVIEELNTKITALNQSLKLAGDERDKAIARATEHEQTLTLQTVATTLGFNPDALLSLTKSGILPEIKIENEKILFGGKEFNELVLPGWVGGALNTSTQSQGNSQQGSSAQPPKSPSNGMASGNPSTESAFTSVLSSMNLAVPIGVKK